MFRHFNITMMRAIIGRGLADQFQSSYLGALWLFLHPLVMIGIYTVVFSGLMRATLPGSEDVPFGFSIYLCSGLIPWLLFSDTVTRMTSGFLAYSGTLKNSALSLASVPFIVIALVTVNFVIMLFLFLGFLLIVGKVPSVTWLFALPLFLIQSVMGGSLGLIAGIINVFFRDLGQAVVIIMQLWFWVTPIVYTKAVLSGRFASILELNPIAPLIDGYQGIFLFDRAPTLDNVYVPLLFSTATLFVAFVIFNRVKFELADSL